MISPVALIGCLLLAFAIGALVGALIFAAFDRADDEAGDRQSDGAWREVEGVPVHDREVTHVTR